MFQIYNTGQWQSQQGSMGIDGNVGIVVGVVVVGGIVVVDVVLCSVW